MAPHPSPVEFFYFYFFKSLGAFADDLILMFKKKLIFLICGRCKKNVFKLSFLR